MTVQPDDPFVAQVEAGTLSGAAACVKLLNLPVFTSSNRISTTLPAAQQDLAKSILRTMNDVHMSWFVNKKFNAGNGCQKFVTPSTVDSTEPALFFTQALFDNNADFSKAVTGARELRAIRSVDNPTLSIFDRRLASSDRIGGLPTSFKMTPNGELMGIMAGQDPEVPFALALDLDESEDSRPRLTNPRPLANRGGGLIGSQAYLLNNFPDMAPAIYNLAKMPRPFAKYVFQDLLCRELPVISVDDAKDWAVCPTCAIKPPTGAKVLPFRQQASCVACHASMDQMGGIVRNYRFFTQSTATNDLTCSQTQMKYKSVHVLPLAPTIAAGYGWGYSEDPNYHKRTALGRFVYRPMNGGKMINDPIANFEELGAKIESLEDYYICGAKRYYRYFTGIDVSLQPMTAAEVAALPEDQKFYRNKVLNLGRKFRKPAADGGYDKDPKKLIKAILESAEFANKDFSILKKAQGN